MRISTVLKRLWGAWKKFGEAVGDFIARVVLTVFYMTVFVPFGIGVRLFGDRMRITTTTNGEAWQHREATDVGLEAARRQF